MSKPELEADSPSYVGKGSAWMVWYFIGWVAMVIAVAVAWFG